LDKRKGIVVPGSINTYLREYQREGAMFFWELYNKGHGGLLGDDMGLVSSNALFFLLLLD
jgi:SNF2 family DNA or RNA helicase